MVASSSTGDARVVTTERRAHEGIDRLWRRRVPGFPARALAVAARYAGKLRAELIVASVAPVPDPVGLSYGYAPMGRPAALRAPMADTRTEAELDGSKALLEQMAAEAGIEGAELRTMVGIPAERLAELADEERADLIIVGSRGRGAFRSAFLGSVSNSLIGIARCPVLVVPRAVTEAASGADEGHVAVSHSNNEQEASRT